HFASAPARPPRLPENMAEVTKTRRGAMQSLLQASSSVWLPSSHSSGPFFSLSPHRGPNAMHPEAQKPYIPLFGPSSQSSTPACTCPSPQVAFVQFTQSSVFSSLPSSHCSPGSSLPSPQSDSVFVQSASHPSPGV